MRVRVYRRRDGWSLVTIEPARRARLAPVSFYAPTEDGFKEMVLEEVTEVARVEALPFPRPAD